MFVLALFLGVIAYSYFFLGIAGLLYPQLLFSSTVVLGIIFLYLQRKPMQNVRSLKIIGSSKLILVLVLVLVLQGIVNIIGALSPELAFDALWYHLTLPKMYLIDHSVHFIPGGLLHYSAMPQLGEMLYVGALALGNEITVKVVHFFFGLLTAVSVYLLTRKYFKPFFAVIAVVIFYSNLVVAWESTTAYIDLIRAFFEILALWAFLQWFELRKRKWFVLSAIMVGLAICTKLLALGSLLIFSGLIVWSFVWGDRGKKGEWGNLFGQLFIYWFVGLFVALPWFVYAFVNTGNPVYPLFSSSELSPESLSFFHFLPEVWNGFMRSSDPISPLYMIFFPLIIVFYPKFSKEIKLIAIYSLLAIIIWYFTPRMGGGRFLLPYLPAFSILCAAVLSNVLKNVRMTSNYLFIFLLLMILFTSVITIGYRFVAEIKYLPVLFGQQTKHEFLSENLNFAFGDFYDVDKYFERNIASDDRVLLYGFHNLYYVDFPFIHEVWVKPGDTFNYVAVQNGRLPEKFRDWKLIYSSNKTKVKLYRPSRASNCPKLCVY